LERLDGSKNKQKTKINTKTTYQLDGDVHRIPPNVFYFISFLFFVSVLSCLIAHSTTTAENVVAGIVEIVPGNTMGSSQQQQRGGESIRQLVVVVAAAVGVGFGLACAVVGVAENVSEACQVVVAAAAATPRLSSFEEDTRDMTVRWGSTHLHLLRLPERVDTRGTSVDPPSLGQAS